MTLPAQSALESLARRVAVSVQQAEAVLTLLDDGHSLSYIARYRRDRTQGLNEATLRRIKSEAHQLHVLDERRQTILKSIESQGKLDDPLREELLKAETLTRLEDLYLPYKPRKQSLADTARNRGLNPLVEELLQDAPAAANLDQRLADFVSPERDLRNVGDVLLGVGHLVAEIISQRADLRSLLRRRYLESARVVSRRAKPPVEKPTVSADMSPKPTSAGKGKADATALSRTPDATSETVGGEELETDPTNDHDLTAELERELDHEHGHLADVEGDESETHEAHGEEQDEAGDSWDVTTPVAHETELGQVAEPGQVAELGQVAEPGQVAELGQVAGASPASVVGESSTESENAPAGTSLTESEAHRALPGDDAAISHEASMATSHGVEPTGSAHAIDSTAGGTADSATEVMDRSGEPDAGALVQSATRSTETVEPIQSTGEQADPLGGFQFPTPQPFPVPDASGIGIETGAAHFPPVVISAPPMTKSAARKQAAKAAKERKRERLERVFQEYFRYQEQLNKVPLHRLLGLLRGERVRVLHVTIETDVEALCQEIAPLVIPDGHHHADLLRGCVRDAIVRLVLPSLEREVRRQWNDRVEQHVIDVFARNLRLMLLQQPLKQKIAAVTCDARGNGRLVVLDADGRVLQHESVRFWAPVEEIEASRLKLIETIKLQGIGVIAIGNGATCRRIEHLVSDVLAKELNELNVSYTIVNEAGCAVYATSALGREELPDLDGESRAAVSLGRRLLDPLGELTKIPPTNLNAGRYQAELKAKHLREQIEDLVSSLVNEIGLDINQANPATLCFVAGLNQLTARRLYDRRVEQGPYHNRVQFLETIGITPEVFVEAAGFLRVMSGDNPFDAGWIHPDDYAVAERLLAKLACGPEQLRQILAGGDEAATARKQLATGSDRLDWATLAKDLDASESLIRDLLYAFRNLGRDPRDHSPAPILRKGLLRFEDLQPNMELHGTVLNVAPFGVFVDIGLSDSALVHISRLSTQYVQDPHDVAAPGDAIRVWVHSIDTEKRRVALTAIDPRSRRREAPPVRPPAQRSSGTPQGGSARTAQPPRKSSRPSTPPPKRSLEVKPKAKPVKPITKAMAEGKEPLRSFSDLLQFMDRKTEKPDSEEKRG